jgi:short-subunit dehydrogenase
LIAQLGNIAVNILALTDLSLRFSDQLIRHRGGILNVGSITRLSAGARHGGVLCVQGLCPVVQRNAAL